MLSCHLAVQGPGNGASVLRLIRRTASAAQFDYVTGLFAYVTEQGAKLLIDALQETMSGWKRAQKRWLVSLDYGRSEPEALKVLSTLSSSKVFAPYADKVLARRLRPFICFHPKSLIL